MVPRTGRPGGQGTLGKLIQVKEGCDNRTRRPGNLGEPSSSPKGTSLDLGDLTKYVSFDSPLSRTSFSVIIHFRTFNFFLDILAVSGETQNENRDLVDTLVRL